MTLLGTLRFPSGSHGIPPAKLDHWRRNQFTAHQRLTICGVNAGVGRLFEYNLFWISCRPPCARPYQCCVAKTTMHPCFFQRGPGLMDMSRTLEFFAQLMCWRDSACKIYLPVPVHTLTKSASPERHLTRPTRTSTMVLWALSRPAKNWMVFTELDYGGLLCVSRSRKFGWPLCLPE